MAEDEPDSQEKARSGGTKSRDDAKRETREALIAAGIAAFAAEGIDAPSLDSICARAGYTRGAFYVHFKDRDDFLIAVMTTALESFLDAVIATGDAALDLEKTIAMFVAAVGQSTFPVMGGGVHFHQFMAACARNERIRERYVEVLSEAGRRVAIAIREGQGARTVRSDIDADAVGLMLVALVAGVQGFLEVAFPVGDVITRAASDLVKMLQPG
ncbi:MAG TPA: TetR/AcrR family transcriptional regulator [Polyangiaceae bacterium]|nr:TetR/AcrR family transcriptional regulator [Polyangiaceae bacterium]